MQIVKDRSVVRISLTYKICNSKYIRNNKVHTIDKIDFFTVEILIKIQLTGLYFQFLVFK